MGQKSNIQTLRKSSLNLNLLSNSIKQFAQGFKFSIYFKKLLDKKAIFLTSSVLNFCGNQGVLNINLFFRLSKINSYNRKSTSVKTLLIKKNLLSNKVLTLLFSKIYKRLKSNLFVITYKNLNTIIEGKYFLFKFFFKKFKYLQVMLFPRRFNFFIDFLKISILFFESKIDLNFYIFILSQIFKILQKRRHNLFISFVEQLFKVFIYDLKNYSNQIKGIKFMICGRIQAKPRAKFKYFQLGNIPLQTLDSRIEYSKKHDYTIYGVFGFKMWIYRN